jgi:hypothetical protein
MNAFSHKNNLHSHDILSSLGHTLHNRRFWAITAAVIATVVLLTLISLLPPNSGGLQELPPSGSLPYYPGGF